LIPLVFVACYSCVRITPWYQSYQKELWQQRISDNLGVNVSPNTPEGGVAEVLAGSNITLTGSQSLPVINALAGVTSITAGSNTTITGTAQEPIINSANFNNFVSYNVGGGFSASPYTVNNLGNGAFTTLTKIDHTISYPLSGAAYQLTFSWSIRNVTFDAVPAGNVYVVVLNGPDVNSGTTIGQSACFVNANIPVPPTVGAIALGTCSCLIINDNDVDCCIGFGNFSGQKIDTASIEIYSVSVTFLSDNPTVVNNF
jgi:hypothetical protein